MNKGPLASFTGVLKKPLAARNGVLLTFGNTTGSTLVVSYLTDASANVITDAAGNRITIN